MPEMDGAHFLEVLRSYLRWQDVPAILVTAYPEDPGIDHAAELGVTEVFRKGRLDLDELLAAVERNLGYPPAGAAPMESISRPAARA
jgi:CheY-like chemotaxis protein